MLVSGKWKDFEEANLVSGTKNFKKTSYLEGD